MGKVQQYLKGRFTELIPKQERSWAETRKQFNPIPSLKLINVKTWLFIISAFMSFAIEATDFFIVALNVKKISKDFNVQTTSVTWGMTLALMTRVIGAVLFGYIGDRFGRKMSFILNLILIMSLQIVTGFATSFRYFLVCRALFGIALGGCFGSAATQCFDDLPRPAYSWISGAFQQAYSFGYLVAVILTRALADTTKKEWRSCTWFVSGVSFLMILFRIALPETNAFKESRRLKQLWKDTGGEEKGTLSQIFHSFLEEWYTVVYMVLLMIGFNYFSHSSQDLFPTMLTNQLGFTSNESTMTNCLANIGAIVGGLILPHLSTLCSRRFIIILCLFCAACLIYPWGFVHNKSINASVFFLQFFVQGSWGLVPLHLHQLAPLSETRSFFIGVSYQLGNLASSAASTIESSLGHNYPIKGKNPDERTYDYGRVMTLLVGVTIAYMLIVVFLGPEANPRMAKDQAYDADARHSSTKSAHSAKSEDHRDVYSAERKECV